MDINILLKNVNNLNEYISVTQDVSNKCKNSKIQINITTVLSLKKIRSYEIEYFSKCEENGLACVILERMLCLPPTKTWGVLGKELVNLLQYWLDGVRKHLISHSLHWWIFMKLLLKFIMDIRSKNSAIPNMLVEQTAECLLDLATNERPDVFQRHEILHSLNIYCVESSREIRFALRHKFAGYFVKLSTYMATCGHLPCQFSILETLLRWLLPRQDTTLRLTAAAKWFPQPLYGTRAVDIFLERPWQNFYQDARDFLNALNATSDLVTSVVCKKLSIGKFLITGTEKRDTWMDMNTGGRCVSVQLDPKMLESFGVPSHRACETLVITGEDTRTAQLHREKREMTISLNTLCPPQLRPSAIKILDDDTHDVTIVVSSRTDARQLDRALRRIFGDKYQMLLDIDSEHSQSPQRSYTQTRKICNSSEEESRFSHPVEVRRRTRSGYIVRTRYPVSCNSPSTASTSSLAHLHEKLAALPRYKYEKEPVALCAMPELSVVTELSETDDRQSCNTTNSTLKFTNYGVCHRNIKTRVESTSRKSHSDGECVKQKVKLGRCVSPVVNEEHSTSLLFLATLGTSDDSVIKDTVERLSKIKDFNDTNIVDLLVHEALQAQLIPKNKEKLLDSGINTGENRKTQGTSEENSEAIENTPYEKSVNHTGKTKVQSEQTCTVISNSTSGDESNTEFVNETPLNHVNLRKTSLYKIKKKENTKIDNFDATKKQSLENIEEQTFSVKEVEDFFTQHFTETKAGGIVISPTLAKKINETSSETSESFDEKFAIDEDFNTNVGQFEFNNTEIVECLNSMVDKVCNDFDKCTDFFNKEIIEFDRNEAGIVGNLSKEAEPKAKKNMKLKYNSVTKRDKAKTRATKKRKNKLELESTTKMSTIIEVNDDLTFEENGNKKIASASNRTPENIRRDSTACKTIENVTRRKRKLYSPKDDQIQNAKHFINFTDTDEEDTVLSELKTYKALKTPKSSSTCYKEIAEERQKRVRAPRTRKSKTIIAETPSPRTFKMNAVFDKLKDTVNSDEKIILANKKSTERNVYNFTSDSEDEDFKKKKTELQKRVSTTTVGSFESAVSTRHGRMINRVDYSESKSSNDDTNKKKNTKRNKVVKRQTKKRKVITKVVRKNEEPLIDERMRDAINPEILNTSIVAETFTDVASVEPELMLQAHPQMEAIDDIANEVYSDILPPKKKNVNRKNNKTNLSLSLKKEKGLNPKDSLMTLARSEKDGTESPLPGLVVESVPTRDDDANDSVTANMLQKFKKIYEEGPDAINESANTQYMLSDVEKNNYSSRNVQNLSTKEEIYCENDLNIRDSQFEYSKHKSTKNQIPKKKGFNEDRNNSRRKHIRNVKDTDPEDIYNEIDLKSEKSIATVGITGHGDIDESPPSLGMIKRTLQPRGLELEDLDQSMKDYFLKLSREIDESGSKDTFRDTCDKIIIKETPFKDTRSPVVSVKRLSLDDISRWLPSRRNSYSDQSSTETNYNAVEKENRRPKVMSSEVERSPIVPVVRLSFEEFSKWLPMPEDINSKQICEKEVVSVAHKDKSKSNLQLIFKQDNKSNSKKSYLRDHSNIADTSKNVNDDATLQRKTKPVLKLAFPDEGLKADTFDLQSVDNSSVKKVSPAPDKNKCKVQIPKESPDKDIRANSALISPVKSFEGFITKRSDTEQSEDENLIKRIKKRFSNKETAKQTKATSPRRRQSPVNETKKNTSDSSISSLARKEDSIIIAEKRKSSPILKYAKKAKAESAQAFTISESGPSVSSVHDWFKRIDISYGRAEGMNLSFRDNIQNVMEKLDTTLVEINRNTSKKFVNFFVETQKHLAKQKEERRNMQKRVASHVISEIVKLMDKEFADLNKISQEMDTDFMHQLKERASELIREDCEQKRALVHLLKEDVQAVMDHMDRNLRTESA